MGVLIPAAIIIGIIGGCMGALFININSRMNKWRGMLLKSNWIKPVETYFFAFGTATLFFWVPYWARNIKGGGCRAWPEIKGDHLSPEEIHK